MALRGNLKDFSLPDVFQLVTLSRKTGILRIRRADGAEGSVWFRDGDVFFAQSNWNREPLGSRLVAAGKVTASALTRALDAQKAEGDGGRRLGQILIDEGYISEKVLEAFVQEQIQDTIFDLFRWDEGAFDFESLASAPDEDIGLAVSIENIVMEGSRRLEEWTRIKKKIPSMEIVFKMATAPGEGTFEISLKPVEWNLLLLVDGTRSVADLAQQTGRTDFDVSRILYGLFSAGLLEVASDEEVDKLRADRARLEARAAELKAKSAPKRPAAPSKLRAVPPKRAAASETPAQAAKKPAEAETPRAEAPTEATPEREPEVPTFLSEEQHEPSAQDMAVFEEMMGAVLHVPAAPAVAPSEEQAAVEPEVAGQNEAPAPPSAGEAAVVVGEAVVETASTETIEVSVEDVEAVAPEDEAVEAPADLPVEPMGVTTFEQAELEVSASDFFTGQEIQGEEPETAALPGDEAVEESTADETAEILTVTVDQVSIEGMRIPEIETEAEAGPVEEQPGAAMELEGVEFVEPGLEPTDAPEVEIVPEPLEDEADEQASWLGGEEADTELTDLLSSLRDEGEEPLAVETEDGPDTGTDADEETTVISTDAFLSDFDEMDGQPFSGGLADELTALTGGGRSRPVTTPAPAPASEHTIQRDQMVDRELVMKVIEGIQDL